MTDQPSSVEMLQLSQLTPYPGNARNHPPEQIQRLADGIRRLGFLNPILIDDAGVIIAGHGRYEAAQVLGLDRVPVVRLHVSPEKARLMRLEDNALAEGSSWDIPALFDEVDRLAQRADEDFQRLFDSFDIDALVPTGGASPASADTNDDDDDDGDDDAAPSDPKPLTLPPPCPLTDADFAPAALPVTVPLPARLPAVARPAIDTSEADALAAQLSAASDLSDDERAFLRLSASRRVRLNRSALTALFRRRSLSPVEVDLLARCGALPISEVAL